MVESNLLEILINLTKSNKLKWFIKFQSIETLESFTIYRNYTICLRKYYSNIEIRIENPFIPKEIIKLDNNSIVIRKHDNEYYYNIFSSYIDNSVKYETINEFIKEEQINNRQESINKILQNEENN